MTYKFSTKSKSELLTCHPDLQRLFNEVIKHVDCTIIEGHRSFERQEELFKEGKSHLRAGQSKHNIVPSMAVDVAPYPIDWDDRERFLLFAGFVKGLAAQMGIAIRMGADWDGDFTAKDQTFHDAVHFELVTNQRKVIS